MVRATDGITMKDYLNIRLNDMTERFEARLKAQEALLERLADDIKGLTKSIDMDMKDLRKSFDTELEELRKATNSDIAKLAAALNSLEKWKANLEGKFVVLSALIGIITAIITSVTTGVIMIIIRFLFPGAP